MLILNPMYIFGNGVKCERITLNIFIVVNIFS